MNSLDKVSANIVSAGFLGLMTPDDVAAAKSARSEQKPYFIPSHGTQLYASSSRAALIHLVPLHQRGAGFGDTHQDLGGRTPRPVQVQLVAFFIRDGGSVRRLRRLRRKHLVKVLTYPSRCYRHGLHVPHLHLHDVDDDLHA
ncbi:hypothetical protein B0H16DRAFT_1720526 [Mycena metata]|uniref:Uncharacterized protein n=1 Tax=Mycena metata TaxID=1033252 RepID=A0AAD7J8I3_9AGAR|nr:hypothetical protein B0H16DRAFT_1720526 [Mycena metata]